MTVNDHAEQPIAGFGLSVATWDAVMGYAKTLSLELAAAKINVNTICPGYIETERLQKVFAASGEDAKEMRAKLVGEVPMRRIGSVDDIAPLGRLLNAAGMPTEIVADPMGAVWSKFVFNCVMSPVGAR